MTFLEAIKKGDAANATALLETVLNQKTLAYIKEQKAVVSKEVYGDSEAELSEGKRTDPYDGPFPRKRHSHKCTGCEKHGQHNAVACYKSKCTRPQKVSSCGWCQTSPTASTENQ